MRNVVAINEIWMNGTAKRNENTRILERLGIQTSSSLVKIW